MSLNPDTDAPKQPSFIPCGWIGGFSGNQPYPNSALLDSLPFEGNLDNIQKITRMLRAKWPEFSWETAPGKPATRMYQMFAPDISRLGYDDTGQVRSIICPQQGVYFPSLGVTMNIEVTVTGNKGWMNENAEKDKLFASDITIKPTIWFSPDSADGWFWQKLLQLDKLWNNTLPLSKVKGIRINATDESGLPGIQVRMGERLGYPFPDRTKHWRDYAWAVANLAVKIGNIDSTGNSNADEFNSWVMDLFNVGSGNLLLAGNVLTWNLWAGSPELVDQEEWQNHAQYWRYSIDVNHRPPNGEGTSIADFAGNPFDPGQAYLYAKAAAFAAWVAYQLS